MNRILTLFATALLLTTAITALGDIAKPREVPSPSREPRIVFHTRLAIVPDAKAYEARLQISESDLKELRAALNNMPGNNSVAQRVTHSSTRTIMAGVFMFLSLSFAGIWLARSVQSRGQKAMVGLLLGTAVIGAAAIITQANAGPPGSYYWKKLPQNLSQGQATGGGVDVMVVPDGSDGSGMRLIIPIRPN